MTMNKQEKKKVWFASDHHFGHEFMRKLRNFETIEEHDNAIIEAHNRVVKPGDDVYFLGDFIFRSKTTYDVYAKKLNGNLHLLRGNHDKLGLETAAKGFIWVKDYYELIVPDIDKEPGSKGGLPNKLIVMSHYPMYCWNKNKRGSFMLHGHTHNGICNTEVSRGKIMDMEISEKNNFEPYELEDVFSIMRERAVFAPDCEAYV